MCTYLCCPAALCVGNSGSSPTDRSPGGPGLRKAISMTAPQGHWRIVAAGFVGDLDLTADPQGNIHGTVKIDAPNVEQIHGFWDEAEQRLIFQRPVQNAGGKPQNYTGFLFEAASP